MANRTCEAVTMRVRVGDREIEVTGPSDFVEKKIAEFLTHNPAPPEGPGIAKPPVN
jgi:predicted metal-dependent hydrolase